MVHITDSLNITRPDDILEPLSPTLEALAASANQLPRLPGVYHFYGETDALLYVGKSINLRERVKSHLAATKTEAKERRLMNQTRRIEHQVTAGELGALLLENYQIKTLKPIHNRRQRRHRQLVSLQLSENSTGFLQPKIITMKAAAPQWDQVSFGVYRNVNALKAKLDDIIATQKLCPVMLGLQKGNGPCFAHQINRCAGACVGKDSADEHNQRLQQSVIDSRIDHWDDDQAMVVVEQGAEAEDWHLIYRWCYLGTAQSEASLQTLIDSEPATLFDVDSYKILLRFIKGEDIDMRLIDWPGTTS